MTHEELNHYILHYLKEDKTNSAIMLTAPWGTGKSYYIQNELIPFLKQKQEEKIKGKNEELKKSKKRAKKKAIKREIKEEKEKGRVICVSLYGLACIKDINKSIYFENKASRVSKRKKVPAWVKAYGKPLAIGSIGIAKTVLKSLTTIDLDLSIENPNMEKLYSSVNLRDKLLVFEDLERTSISIIELLGYVNNLVEQDGVKVLLVANEQEILNYLNGAPDNKGIIHRVPDDNTQEYLRKKEKTVSDTILFVSDNKEKTIESILRSFKNSVINKLLEVCEEKPERNVVAEISGIMEEVKCDNLRSVIFGCQKAVDLFQLIGDELDYVFARTLLLSLVAFSLRKKGKDDLSWEVDDFLCSPRLGTEDYPLLKETYDFVTDHSFSKEDFIFTQKTFLRQKEFERRKGVIRNNLDRIYYSHLCTENEVVAAIKAITKSLEETKDIPCIEFGKLANYLVYLRPILDQDNSILRCKQAMLRRLRIEGGQQEKQAVSFHDGIELHSNLAQAELKEWKKEMLSAISEREQRRFDFDFDYQPESVIEFCKSLNSRTNDFIENKRFASLFDVDRFLSLLKTVSSKEIYALRDTFLCVYRMSNIEDFFADDFSALQQIVNGLEKQIDNREAADKLALHQLRLFLNNLKEMVNRLTEKAQVNPEES